MRRLTRHVNPAMIVAIVALVSSLTGGAIAASMISGKQIRDSSVTGADIRNASLTGADLKNRSVTGADVKPGSLGADRLSAAARASLKGQAGPAGPQGPQGIQGPAGPGTGVQTISEPAFDRFTINDAVGTVDESPSLEGGYAFHGETGAVPRLVTLTGVLPGLTGAPDGSSKVLAAHLCLRATAAMQLRGVAVDRVRPSQLDGLGQQTFTAMGSDDTDRTSAGCFRIPFTEQSVQPGDAFRMRLIVSVTENAGTIGGTFRVYSTALEVQP